MFVGYKRGPGGKTAGFQRIRVPDVSEDDVGEVRIADVVSRIGPVISVCVVAQGRVRHPEVGTVDAYSVQSVGVDVIGNHGDAGGLNQQSRVGVQIHAVAVQQVAGALQVQSGPHVTVGFIAYECVVAVVNRIEPMVLLIGLVVDVCVHGQVIRVEAVAVAGRGGIAVRLVRFENILRSVRDEPVNLESGRSEIVEGLVGRQNVSRSGQEYAVHLGAVAEIGKDLVRGDGAARDGQVESGDGVGIDPVVLDEKFASRHDHAGGRAGIDLVVREDVRVSGGLDASVGWAGVGVDEVVREAVGRRVVDVDAGVAFVDGGVVDRPAEGRSREFDAAAVGRFLSHVGHLDVVEVKPARVALVRVQDVGGVVNVRSADDGVARQVGNDRSGAMLIVQRIVEGDLGSGNGEDRPFFRFINGVRAGFPDRDRVPDVPSLDLVFRGDRDVVVSRFRAPVEGCRVVARGTLRDQRRPVVNHQAVGVSNGCRGQHQHRRAVGGDGAGHVAHVERAARDHFDRAARGQSVVRRRVPPGQGAADS